MTTSTKKTAPRKLRGAQIGNTNAQRGEEPNDGQLPLRVPRAWMPRLKSATYITGDHGLNEFTRRLIADELARLEGAKVEVIQDHEKALQVLRAAGHDCPAIQPDANTAELWFEMVDGQTALAINQTGFARKDSDNEEQVNGCTVLVAAGNLSALEGMRLIQRFLRNAIRDH